MSRLSLARSPRAALLAGLVLLTVGLGGALAWEAYRASRSHRLTAERLLRDYASFAAFELLANAEKSLEGTLAVALGPMARIAESPFDPLLAFALACIGIVALRKTSPDIPRPFRTPWVPWVPIIGALAYFIQMVALPLATWERLVIWLVIGFVVYFAYGKSRAELLRSSRAPAGAGAAVS